MKLTGTRIFVNWIFTILLGSLFGPLVFLLISLVISPYRDSFYGEFSGYFFVVIIAAILSALISLPSLVIWLISLNVLNKRKPTYEVIKSMHLTHFITFALTLIVAIPFFLFFDGIDSLTQTYLLFCLATFWYMIVGASVWFFRMKNLKKVAEKSPLLNEELIDVF